MLVLQVIAELQRRYEVHLPQGVWVCKHMQRWLLWVEGHVYTLSSSDLCPIVSV